MTETAKRDAGWLTLPNLITVARFLLIAPIVVLIMQRDASATLIVLTVLFGASDWVDGFVARRTGTVSRVGEILDPVADRLGIILITVALLIAGAFPLWVVITIVVVDATVAAFSLIRFADIAVLHVSWVEIGRAHV